MKIKWLIQDVGLIVSQMYRKFDALKYMDEKISGIGVVANCQYISGLEDAIENDLDTKYVLLTGVKVLNLLKSAKTISDVLEFPTEFHIENSEVILKALVEGMYYDYTKFDQAYYGELDLPLLNQSAIYVPIKENLKKSFSEDKFVKPSRDLKAFDAGILKAGETIEEFVMSKSRQRFFLEEKLVVSDVLEMRDEYRFFVVEDKVVAGSAYRVGGKVGENAIVPEIVMRKAREYALLYKPADVFTMDLARLNDDSIKVIEYNCFNCSGVYLCDLVETYGAIKNYLKNKEDSTINGYV
jgi:hypothetical protein